MSEYPTSPRPRKRQRTGKGKVGTDRPNLTEVNFILQAVLRFLDIVAGEDSTSETDQENESEPDDEEDHERHSTLSPGPTIIKETDWEGVLERAKLRGKKIAPRTDDNCYSDEVILQLKAADFLWEIRCIPGQEDTLRSKVKIATESSLPYSLPTYIYTHKDLPGRIYAEMPSAKRTHTPQTWTTISRGASKWKRYEGDIALVALHRSRLVAIIIPRIALSKIEGKKRRASARPCKLVDLHISLGNNTEAIGNGFYTYKDHVFTPDGFIITDIEDVPTKPPHEHPVPTYEVLRTYRESEWLTPSMYQQTEREIAQRQIKIHDRVQITAGVYLGLTGNIIDISSTEASVFIESQDHTPNSH
ncbi:hypothetical protein BJ912DRAFT_1066517 [Pholiota molesta]|nr:hypothetical protein BJ912DRAFT_1066517 [Pholiota molesta]